MTPPLACQFFHMTPPPLKRNLFGDDPLSHLAWFNSLEQHFTNQKPVEALLFVVGFIDINVAKNFSSYFETVSEY